MKFLLLPFSWLYGFANFVRNKSYDRGIFKSYSSSLKTIVVGNLQVGGSGKTPHTAYLYKFFGNRYRTAILSRGYGRKTKGLIEAGPASTPASIGDEPFWYYKTLPKVRVIVSESRKNGLKHLEHSGIELVLLDDAYQHRAITGNINILLTDYKLPYFDDHLLPYGRLREYSTGDKRADIIIVSKCPESLSLPEKISMIQEINPFDHQSVFFTAIVPGNLFPLKGEKSINAIEYSRVIALSGIASPDLFNTFCEKGGKEVKKLEFPDHHVYTPADIMKINEKLKEADIVITTEKDAVKLSAQGLIENLPENRIFVLSVEVKFLFDENNKFNDLVTTLLADKTKSKRH